MNNLFIQKYMNKTSKNITVKYWNGLDITSTEVLEKKIIFIIK